MAKIAIDVAILPPENIMDICIELNQKSLDIYYNLNKTDSLPHISMAMGVTDENDLEEINRKIKIISEKFSSLNLEISGIDETANLKNHKAVGLIIKINESLVDLHAQIMKELLPILTYNEVSSDMFYRNSSEEIDEISKSWVRNYGTKHADPKNYHPHMSLKCRDAQYTNFPIKFIANRLAICHMGRNGTCRKIFKEFILK